VDISATFFSSSFLDDPKLTFKGPFISPPLTSPPTSRIRGDEVVKIECEVCGILGTLQKVGRNYYRIRHYDGVVNSKPRFHYHQNSKEYVENLLEKLRN